MALLLFRPITRTRRPLAARDFDSSAALSASFGPETRCQPLPCQGRVNFHVRLQPRRFMGRRRRGKKGACDDAPGPGPWMTLSPTHAGLIHIYTRTFSPPKNFPNYSTDRQDTRPSAGHSLSVAILRSTYSSQALISFQPSS